MCLTNKDIRDTIDREYVTVKNNISKSKNYTIFGIIRNK